jgi:heme exporter protein CcmD
VNEWGYVIAGWAITFVVLVAYAVWIVLRGRALSKQVPPEERRWM